MAKTKTENSTSNSASKTHFRYFGVVINAPKESPQIVADLRVYEDVIQDSMDFLFVATIIHDKDFYEDGTAKLTHLHAFIDTGKEDNTPKQMTDLLASKLGINRTQISLEVAQSEVGLLQYLTHQNQKQKAQYKADLIRTTNQERLNHVLAIDIASLKTKQQQEDEAILEAMKNSPTLMILSEQVGISTANKYRSTYNQIREESKTDIKSLWQRVGEAERDLKVAYNILRKIAGEYRAGALMIDDIEEAEDFIDYCRKYNLI